MCSQDKNISQIESNVLLQSNLEHKLIERDGFKYRIYEDDSELEEWYKKINKESIELFEKHISEKFPNLKMGKTISSKIYVVVEYPSDILSAQSS